MYTLKVQPVKMERGSEVNDGDAYEVQVANRDEDTIEDALGAGLQESFVWDDDEDRLSGCLRRGSTYTAIVTVVPKPETAEPVAKPVPSAKHPSDVTDEDRRRWNEQAEAVCRVFSRVDVHPDDVIPDAIACLFHYYTAKGFSPFDLQSSIAAGLEHWLHESGQAMKDPSVALGVCPECGEGLDDAEYAPYCCGLCKLDATVTNSAPKPSGGAA